MDLIFGCMYAGKTTELLRRVRQFEDAGAKCLVVNHSLDDRYKKNSIVSHDGESMSAVCTNDLIMVNIDNFDAIFIDEGQFFNDLIPFSYLCNKKRKYLCISGLNGNYKGELFGEMYKLIPKATNVTYLTANCYICGETAMCSKRLSENKTIISVHDKYAPACFIHSGIV